ncbi:unnamed protein product [Alopecurus aequalis]
MDYAAHAAPPAADPHPAYAQHPYGYPYTYPSYHQPDPSAVADPSAASSSYYYSNPTAQADTQAHYNPYASTFHYYDPSAVAYGGGGLAEYYFSAGEASQAPAVSAAQAAPAATGREAGKHFGFDPRRYAQVAAAKAPNGMAPAADATVMHHAQWNAHFGHPLPRNPPRKFIKKAPKVVQPLTCEVCKIECDTLDVLVVHKTGKKHKKNLQKLQDAITPKPAKPPNGAVGASAEPAAAIANGVMPAIQPKKKKKKSSAATPGDLEVKKRRVLEAGAAQGEVKICAACNVVVNSQKVYEFHISGHKHKANVQKQQQAQVHQVA